MKAYVLLLALSFTSFSHEGFFVYHTDTSLLNEIQTIRDFTVDHLDNSGFELYGEEDEITTFLSNKKLVYSPIEQTQKNNLLGYPSFKLNEMRLKKIAKKYPKILSLFSIGKSVEGRDLYVIKISDNVEIDEVEPEVKYISSMHGNEIVGRELTLNFIEELAQKYGSDPEITDLINNTEIYIMPSMNPDGSEKQSRYNANGKDLNRDFPDFTRQDENTNKGRQPETKAVMAFQASRHFSLSANFHGGAVVVNYPWDTTKTRHPMDQHLRHISLVYAGENPGMRNSTSFDNGITNGADWYVLKGGMQDWSDHWHNDLQVTLEVSGQKWPPFTDIPSYYEDNKDSMLKYLQEVHSGAGFVIRQKNVKGKVTISQNGEDLGSYFFSDSEFFRVLPEGEYSFEIETEDAQYTQLLKVNKGLSKASYRVL